MQSITFKPCAIALALKELQRGPINVRPHFVSTDHPMPGTDGTGRQQEQNGRQGRSLGAILALNLFWTAMQLAVPAPLRMRHQAEVLDQGLRFCHGRTGRRLIRFGASWPGSSTGLFSQRRPAKAVDSCDVEVASLPHC